LSPTDREAFISRVLLALAALGLVLGIVRRELLWIAFVAMLALITKHVTGRKGDGR
jgi:hypothetical protein